MIHAALAAALLGATAFWLLHGFRLASWKRVVLRRGLRMPDIDVSVPNGAWPKVSILVPARDEEAAVESSMRSLLAQDYPALEIIAIDDRSADRTGEVLDRLSREDGRLKVLHIERLPEGWLGKNNANARGAALAGGDWILFTDGDVQLAPDALRRAIAFALGHELGHVVALPRFISHGFWEGSFIATFSMFISVKTRHWDLMEPGTSAFIGSGTFNLVRTSDYLRIGGHQALRMEVADDVKLGMILRRSGVRQAAIYSAGAVAVRWQDGFAATARGLFKNAFAGMEWSWVNTLASSLGILYVSVFPVFAALLAPTRGLRLLAAVPILIAMILQGLVATNVGSQSALVGLGEPATGAVLAGVLFWSALSATLRGGIVWRGTKYRLAELKAGCVRVAAYPAAGAVGWD